MFQEISKLITRNIQLKYYVDKNYLQIIFPTLELGILILNN